ncbi:MAG: NAD(P)-binding protein [Planctomycetota bacterium]
MGLLNKDKKRPPLRATGRGAAATQTSNLRPQQVEKLAPCLGACPSGNDVRGWLTILAQREKNGLTLEAACDKAWALEMETNPFPAIMGRVCPHPCEKACNRLGKDGSVAINSVERLLGDWGIERRLAAPRLDVGGPFAERIAVVGAGPAGLSCAYQLARRGYPVTVFESLPGSGGMLRYGIPEYRLPRRVIDREVERITDLGVEIRYGVTVGKDVKIEDLKRDFAAIFVAIGAHLGKKLGCPGEDGPGVYTGTDFLRRANTGQKPPVGGKIVVVGGGDTAIDAARMSLRVGRDVAGVAAEEGGQVRILYRRTRQEMPAIEREIEEALEEGIEIEFLAAPAAIVRDGSGRVAGMKVQRMRLGEPDSSGRRRPVPIEGAIDEIEVDTVITAVSQSPDTDSLGAFVEKGWMDADAWGKTSVERIWSGGDDVNLGIATTAIGNGRQAALSIHAALRGTPLQERNHRAPIGPERIKVDYYETREPARREVVGAADRLASPSVEIDHGITQQAFLDEVGRCFSCGLCFGCERCWMYCTPGCFKKEKEAGPGRYYTIDIAKCDGCNKCMDECPCGFLDML